MDNSNPSFIWDKEFFEKKTTLFTNLQMGFVGAALILMMMDLSKLYLLSPLAVGLILASWYKSNLETVKDEFKNTTVEFAPKSLLIKKPAVDFEQRVIFHQLEEVTEHKENFVSVITLYLNNDADKIELKAIKNSDELIQQLTQAVENRKQSAG
ncbi:hypothetical protein [Neptuniibacter sp.]|uniref:hypothetical protein n=1 Tax=Neptuniibacter sp. TaxID=1962643 RepID=UPI002602E927|nr:hypothetical protein [Neptuniibacter sp.]MCP4596754.1 hypothetical protein [Neptuniibacter sp.]